MHNTSIPQLLIGAMVLVAVVLGLIATGGFSAGKMEKRDRARAKDIRELDTFVRCVAKENDNQLPKNLEPNKSCNMKAPLKDRFSDKPYEYEKISETKYKICADFEVQNPREFINTYPRTLLDDAGCATFTYKP